MGKRGSRKKQSSGGGAAAENVRQGYRSEQLADYVFTAWGTVTPVRGGNDHGLDLYCSLTDRVEQRALVREFFTVQVKSEGYSWPLGTPDAVKWFIDHPTPLFLCIVDKHRGCVSIYHTMVRFFLAAEAVTLESIELVPGGEEKDSHSYPYERDLNGIPFNGGKARVRLGWPIIEVTGLEVFDENLLGKHKEVLRSWLQIERRNLVRAHTGLRRNDRPGSYRTNVRPDTDIILGLGLPPDIQMSDGLDSYLTNVRPSIGIISGGLGLATDIQMSVGLRWLREAVEVIGIQLEYRDRRDGAALMAMVYRWLQREFPDVFKHDLSPGRFFQTVGELGERFHGTKDFAGVDALLDHVARVAQVLPEQRAQLSPAPVIESEQPPAKDAVPERRSTPTRTSPGPVAHRARTAAGHRSRRR